MSGQHTPEPWAVSAMGGGIYSGDVSICQFFDNAGEDYPNYEANARRIVACVNACAGIPTEQLESIKGNSALQTAARVKNAELITQRNQLLSALKGMVEVARLTIGWHCTPPGANGPLVVAEQTITSVEAQS